MNNPILVSRSVSRSPSDIVILPNGPFTPQSLFGAGENGFIYNPAVVSSLYQDNAGTVPVTADGQLVKRIQDLSGNNNHLIQADDTAALIYRTNGTLHWLAFDGVNDRLIATFASPIVGTVSVAQGFRSDSTSVRYLFDGINATGSQRLSYWGVSSGTLIEIGAGGALHSVAGHLRVTTPLVTQVIARNAGEITHRSGGSETSFGTVGGTVGCAGLTLGARYSQDASFFRGELHGLVGIGRETTETERANLDAWLAALTGVTL